MGKLALPPGFRFHPTDEELISYYLKRKIYGRRIEFEAIGDLDLYKFEPWDLPELARLQTKDLEWYFFCPRDKKYPNGSRTNRATENGYWKATGKDRAVSSRSVSAGMKKTLVYYKGRAPKGERTNWVMHEYRLEDSECERGEAYQNCFVLCRIYQKSGTGPKNGEQYGAPVEEEEWETAPNGETESFSGFGAALGAYRKQDRLQTVSVSGEELNKETTQISMNGKTNGYVVLKAEPEDIFDREETQFINLPAEMLAELREPTKENFLVKAEISDEELDPSVDLIASFLSPPDDGQEEIVEEIQGLVDAPSDCNHPVPEEASVGLNEKNCHLPRDGDFFELNDLSPIIGTDEMTEQTIAGKNIWATNGCNDGCCMNGFGNDAKLQRISEGMEIRAPSKSWNLDSHGQAGGESSMTPYPGLYGALSESCSTDSEELEYKDIPDLFKSFNTLGAGERESCNSEFDGGRLLMNRVQNEQYLDALSSFSGIADMNLHNVFSSFDTTDDQALCWEPWVARKEVSVPWAAKREESVPMQLDNGTIARASGMDMATSNINAGAQALPNQQGTLGYKPDKRIEAAKASSDGSGTSSSKAFGVILQCLGSLPILPASAADMSSRSGTPLGSISVIASSVDIRAIAINCQCVNKDGSAPSCMTCSFEKRGTFVRSLAYTGGRMVVEGSSTSLLSLGVMGAVWAFFWFLILGGSWKLIGGIFRLIFSQ